VQKPRSAKLSRRAEKALDALDVRFRDHIKEAIRELAGNPLLRKKLKGEFEGLRSHRLGAFRIVYRFTEELLEVVYVEHRRDVYR
jgi:mRNA-degrading endonuclease RelE of RelBE toxin-antitoxin system